MKSLFIAAEAEPFVKVGGLGDVAGSLPPALRRLSVDARLMLPLHGEIRRQGFSLKHICDFSICFEKENIPVRAYYTEIDSLPVYFIDGPLMPSDAPVYTPDDQADGLKYAFFSLAALQLVRELDWRPDILHANDWHTAFAVYDLCFRRRKDPFFSRTASVLGVHNLPFMGGKSTSILKAFAIPPASDTRLPEWARDMPLPLGLLSADRIVAVSPTYAQEILTPEFGSGLDSFLITRSSSIVGILNGLNISSWDPATDPQLIRNYDAERISSRKKNRFVLQGNLSLPIDPDALLIGMVNRMDFQKGVDLVPEAFNRLPMLFDQPFPSWQLVILGTGDPNIERETLRLEKDFPNRARVITRFDQNLSRLIYGGVDLMLVPSRYEPCGLTQMISMRYGCVPLGRATGGLSDTINDFDCSSDSTGFLFDDATPEALLGALTRAARIFKKKQTWRSLQQRGMKRDFSWEHSADQYLRLYQSMKFE